MDSLERYLEDRYNISAIFRRHYKEQHSVRRVAILTVGGHKLSI